MKIRQVKQCPERSLALIMHARYKKGKKNPQGMMVTVITDPKYKPTDQDNDRAKAFIQKWRDESTDSDVARSVSDLTDRMKVS